MPLESSRSIRKSKRHDSILKASYTSLEGSKIFVFFYSHSNPIKGMADINLRKELSSYDLSKRLFNKRERISVLLCDSI